MTERKPPRTRQDFILAAARSAFRRYPRHLLDSMRRQALHGADSAAFLAHWNDARQGPAPLLASWLGHASVLLHVGGLSILVDPVLSHRIGARVAGVTLGMRRLLAPPVDPALLGPVDLILITHAHFDHLDKPTLLALRSPRTRVVTARATARLIPPGFADVAELDWAQELRIHDVLIRAIRPRHWGARSAWDRHRGYNAYHLAAPGASVLAAGDTAYTPDFDSLGVHAPPDLAVFGIGAYEPWNHAHATPEEVWRMFDATRARFLLPIHHSTFELGDEPLDEPMRRLIRTAGDAALHRVLKAEPGQVVPIPARPA